MNILAMSLVTFAECTIIIGDYQKALDKVNFKPTTSEAPIELNNSSFTSSAEHAASNLTPDMLEQLEEFTALNAQLYSDSSYTFIQQKGTHDLIWKDPLLIQVLRGKQPLIRIIEQLQQLNLPHGWYVQKPKGMGKPKVIKRWKRVGKFIMFLFFAWLLFKILLTSS